MPERSTRCKRDITLFNFHLNSKEQHKGTTGVLLVDQIGLPIENSGNLDKSQSGLMSSIMKNAARLQQILQEANSDKIE